MGQAWVDYATASDTAHAEVRRRSDKIWFKVIKLTSATTCLSCRWSAPIWGFVTLTMASVNAGPVLLAPPVND